MQVGDIYYYNARWYDPAIGRFLQADTIVPSHQGTQGFDRYAYVNNNPLRYTDSRGNGIDDFFDNLIKKAVNVIDTFERDIIGGQYVRSFDNEINKASQKTGIPTELIAAVIRHESSAIERRIFISDCLADSVEFVQVIIRLQTGRDASIGIGQMQIGTARLLEQTRYVEKGDSHTIINLLNESKAVEYIAGYLHLISDILNQNTNFASLDVEDQNRLILISYNQGVEMTLASLNVGSVYNLINESSYDNQTLDSYRRWKGEIR